jgi:hypothetical protein
MARRTSGRSKLSVEVRERLAQAAREARALVYGADGCPEWGTKFSEIEDDAKEIGHEFIRLVMQQAVGEQAGRMPEGAMTDAAGERAAPQPSVERTVVTESGEVTWNEPRGNLPKSRKAFFPSGEGFGTAGR